MPLEDLLEQDREQLRKDMALDDLRRKIRGPQVDEMSMWDQLYIDFLSNGFSAEQSVSLATEFVEYRDNYLKGLEEKGSV